MVKTNRGANRDKGAIRTLSGNCVRQHSR
jgi:hypothetical protein